MCGFNVIGYDIDKQHAKNYPPRSEMEKLPWGLELEHTISFRVEDVFTAVLSVFDVAIVSPPCSPYTTLPECGGGKTPSNVPKLIEQTRALLHSLKDANGNPIPSTIENVAGAARDMQGCVIGLCGSMFGLPLYRHRIYEMSFECDHQLSCDHEHMCLGARTLLPRQKRTKQADGTVQIEPLPPC